MEGKGLIMSCLINGVSNRWSEYTLDWWNGLWNGFWMEFLFFVFKCLFFCAADSTVFQWILTMASFVPFHSIKPQGEAWMQVNARLN